VVGDTNLEIARDVYQLTSLLLKVLGHLVWVCSSNFTSLCKALRIFLMQNLDELRQNFVLARLREVCNAGTPDLV
jgi:hypothetical protein